MSEAKTKLPDDIATLIQREIQAWDGVTVGQHRFGGVEFRLGRRELGHLHGSQVAELPFPVTVRQKLVASGKADTHRYLPESGWVTYYIRDEQDIAAVVELFRLSYERPWITKSGSDREVKGR